jgi:hypothetical protein
MNLTFHPKRTGAARGPWMLAAWLALVSAEWTQGAAATNAPPRRFKIPRAVVPGFP